MANGHRSGREVKQPWPRNPSPVHAEPLGFFSFWLFGPSPGFLGLPAAAFGHHDVSCSPPILQKRLPPSTHCRFSWLAG